MLKDAQHQEPSLQTVEAVRLTIISAWQSIVYPPPPATYTSQIGMPNTQLGKEWKKSEEVSD